MKYLSVLGAALIASIILITSCGKGDDGNYCQFVSPSFILVDYTESEIDTLILRRYEKNNTFTRPIDTFLLSKGEITYKEIGDDSFSITSTKDPYIRFSNDLYENDWEIYIPATQTTSRITEVKTQFFSKGKSGKECKSYVESMRVNGMKKEYTDWFGDGYRFFVTNER